MHSLTNNEKVKKGKKIQAKGNEVLEVIEDNVKKERGNEMTLQIFKKFSNANCLH